MKKVLFVCIENSWTQIILPQKDIHLIMKHYINRGKKCLKDYSLL
jgi:hypothetical protein